jgi:hypothetical protein
MLSAKTAKVRISAVIITLPPFGHPVREEQGCAPRQSGNAPHGRPF